MRSAGTAAKVIVIGQPCPASAWPLHMYIAARATCAGLAGVVPRQRVQLVLGRERHELVVGGVELDLVDAVAVAVVGDQLRRVLVGLTPPRERLAAPDAADLAHAVARPAAALSLQPLRERDVAW